MGLKIEVGKFYRTREGGKAVCISDCRNSKEYPYAMAYIGGNGDLDAVSVNGLVYIGEMDAKDIVAEWTEPVVRYMNVYGESNVIASYATRKTADSHASDTRVACVRIEFSPGQFDE